MELSQKVNFKQLPPLTPPYTGGAGGGSWQIQAGLFGQPPYKPYDFVNDVDFFSEVDLLFNSFSLFLGFETHKR